MPRTDHWQDSFAAGEISPLLAGKPRSAAYAQGLVQSVNALTGPQGQWMRRPGTLFRHSLDPDQSRGRLHAFAPTSRAAFSLLFTHEQVEVFAVTRNDAPQAPIAQLVAPWSGLEVEALGFAQSANTLFITHPNHPPQQLTFNGSTFALEPLAFVDGPYLALNLNDRHQLSVAGAFVTATGFSPFEPTDLGRAVRVFDVGAEQWHNGTIIGVSSSTVAAVAWDPLVAGSSTLSVAPTGQWSLGAFWAENFPAHVALHDDRLVFANTASNPQSFWMSVAADYLNFAPSLREGAQVSRASAIFGTLNDASLNEITWLAAADYSLLAATISGVWRVYAADGTLSAESIQARRLDAQGAAPVPPIVVGATVLYVDRSSRRVMGLSRDGLSSDLSSTDLSLNAAHLFEPGIMELCADQTATALRLWCRLGDGGLAVLDHSAGEQGIGWTPQALAAGSSPLPAELMTLATASRPSASSVGVEDQVWLVVRRYRNGAWARTLEVLSEPLSHSDPDWPGHFLDSGLIQRAALPTATITGLAHLEGETVAVRSDAGDMGLFTVQDGQVALPSTHFQFSVGLPFVSQAQLPDLDRGTSGSFSLTKARHLFDVRFRVWRSGPFEVGTGEPEFGSAVLPAQDPRFWTIPSPEPHEDQALSDAFPIGFTGDLRARRDEGGWSRRTAVCWRTSGVFGLTILGLGLRIAGGD